MINPASGISNLYQAPATQPGAHSKPAAPSASDTPQDTVHLSKAGLAAAGDIDHDGDSH